MRFHIRYNERNAALPTLCWVVPGLTYSKQYAQISKVKMKPVLGLDRVYYGECDGIVKFGAFDRVENKMFSSRPGFFNTEDESIACIEVTTNGLCVAYTLDFIKQKLKEVDSNIFFLKISQHGEISYIPVEPHKVNEVKAKIDRAYKCELIGEAV